MMRDRAIGVLEKISEHFDMFKTLYYVDDLPQYFNCNIYELLEVADWQEKVKDVYSRYYIVTINDVTAKVFI